MKRTVVRGILAVVPIAVFAVGLLAVVTPAVARSCESQCQHDYRKCVPFCAKNPCFVACETVLEICLSNCGATE